MRLKALVEIYTMHSFAQLQNHIFFKKLVEFHLNLPKIFRNFAKFAILQTDFVRKIRDCSGAAVQKDANLVELEKHTTRTDVGQI